MNAKLTASERVLRLLSKRNARYKFKHLMALAKLTKDELEDAISVLRQTHKNLVFAKFDRTFFLSEVPTWYSNQTDHASYEMLRFLGIQKTKASEECFVYHKTWLYRECLKRLNGRKA